MTIRAKLIAGFLLLAVLMAIQSGVSFFFNDRIMEQVKGVLSHNDQASEEIARVMQLAEQVRRFEKEYFIYVGDRTERQRYAAQWRTAIAALNEQLLAMSDDQPGIFAIDDHTTFDQWRLGLDYYATQFRRIADEVETTTEPPLPAEVNQRIQSGKEHLTPLFDEGDALLKIKQSDSRQAEAAIVDTYEQAEWMFIGLTIVGIGGALLLIFVMPGTVAQSLSELIAAAEQLSEGEVDRPIRTTSLSEFDGLARALERMRITQLAMAERLGRIRGG